METKQLFSIDAGILGGGEYVLSNSQINYISEKVTQSVNSSMGKVLLKGVGTDLINQQFDTARLSFSKRMDDRVSVLDTIIFKVINTIASDAIVFYGNKNTEENRTIWNTVNRSETYQISGTIVKKYIDRPEQELRF
jgi:hypothetical protein